MAKIKLPQSAIDVTKPQAQAIGLRDTFVPGFLCKITPTGHKVFMFHYRTAQAGIKPVWRTDGRSGPLIGAELVG